MPSNNLPTTLSMRIFLIGFMGTGKTHWGKIWAAENGLNFFDLDDEIEKRMNQSIKSIFESKGEDQFRIIERDALHSFGEKDQFILSCGGGTPCFFDNMEWMNSCGITVWLDTPATELTKRLIAEKDHRPLIRNESPETLEAYISGKLAEREKFYKAAKIHLETQYIAAQSFDQIIRRYA